MVSMMPQPWRRPKSVLLWVLVPLLPSLLPTWSSPMITSPPLLPLLKKVAPFTTTWNKYVTFSFFNYFYGHSIFGHFLIILFSSSVILSLPTLVKSFASSSPPLSVSQKLLSQSNSCGSTWLPMVSIGGDKLNLCVKALSNIFSRSPSHRPFLQPTRSRHHGKETTWKVNHQIWHHRYESCYK